MGKIIENKDKKNATLQLSLRAQSGFNSDETVEISPNQWEKIMRIVTENEIIPKNMWIRMINEKPKHHGAYIVFGRINIGTPFESREKFTAFWSGEFGWTDKDGDDYNQLNEGIEFWLNISYIQNPE